MRTALVTGGTGGLGSAVVGTLLEDGWKVVVPWVASEELIRVEPHEGLRLIEADLFDEGAVTSVVAAAATDADAPLAAVVNLVGGFSQPGRVHEAPIEDFEAQLRLNLRPTYLVCQQALPHLLARQGGSIVCVSSRSAVSPSSGSAGYAAAKAAVLTFVKALDVEYRQDGIRANSVLPSIIDTPANRASMPSADFSQWVQPSKLAAIIRFLCSDESSSISGAALPVYDRA